MDIKKVIMEQKDYLIFMNERIYEQLIYAETKNSLFAGILGAAIWALFSISINCLLLEIYIYIIAFSFCISLMIIVFSFYPITRTLHEKKNLFFGGDISKIENGQIYLNDISDVNDHLLEQLAEQNIMVSKIVLRKHKYFSLSMKIFVFGILPFLYIFLIANYIIRFFKFLWCRISKINI
jgi:hypothetical protein